VHAEEPVFVRSTTIACCDPAAPVVEPDAIFRPPGWQVADACADDPVPGVDDAAGADVLPPDEVPPDCAGAPVLAGEVATGVPSVIPGALLELWDEQPATVSPAQTQAATPMSEL